MAIPAVCWCTNSPIGVAKATEKTSKLCVFLPLNQLLLEGKQLMEQENRASTAEGGTGYPKHRAYVLGRDSNRLAPSIIWDIKAYFLHSIYSSGKIAG